MQTGERKQEVVFTRDPTTNYKESVWTLPFGGVRNDEDMAQYIARVWRGPTRHELNVVDMQGTWFDMEGPSDDDDKRGIWRIYIAWSMNRQQFQGNHRMKIVDLIDIVDGTYLANIIPMALFIVKGWITSHEMAKFIENGGRPFGSRDYTSILLALSANSASDKV